MSFLSGLFSDKKTVETSQSNNQTSASNTGLSDQVKDYWSSISGLYNPSSWENVDPNAYQTDAANRTAGYASGLNPAFAQANQIGNTGISNGDISRFMSPYTQNVVDATRANFAQENAKQDAQTNANAAKLGALSGTQPLVARAISQSMRQPGQDATIAGLYDKGFQTSLGAAGQSAGLQVQGLNSANAIASNQSGINQTGFGQGTQLWNQDWQNSGGANAQAAQGAQVLASLSPQSGVTSTGSSTGTGTQATTATPSPFSIASNVAGMAIGAGMFSDERIKENIKPIGETYDGQQIYKYNIKGSPKTEIGLMAHEVEERDPDAVGSIAGIKTVNYDRATKGAEKDKPGMAAGGTVGVKPRESDPHHRLTTAFDAVRGMLERARGGSVLPKFDAGGSVGPSYNPSWNTTVTPAPEASSFDVKKFGEGLSAMGKPKDQSGGGGDDGTGALRYAQQDLSSFMNQHSIKPGYADGGGVDEPAPVVSGVLPPISSTDPDGRSVLPPGPVKTVMSGYAPEGAKVPRSVRTNNPGAINYGPFAKANGATGSDGRLAIFPDADTGYGAMSKLLDVYGRRGQNTVASIIGGLPERPNLAWAPRGVDNNSTDQYIAKVAKDLGIDPNAPLQPEQRQALMRKMASYEAGGTPAAPGSASGVSPAPAVASWGTPSAAPAAPPAEKTWMQRNLPGLTEGVFDSKQMTPSQRLGTALMSVRGPMFEGPANGIARSIMEMDGSRQKDDQIKNQVDQFGRTIGLEDRKVGLAEAKSPSEIALLQAQAAAQRAAAANKEDPTKIYAIREAQAKQHGMDPKSDAYREFVLTGKIGKDEVSPTSQKAILEAVESNSGVPLARQYVNEAMALNGKSTEGTIGRWWAQTVDPNLPAGVRSDTAQATRDLSRTMMGNVLGKLKETFGAAPTEGERKILVDVETAMDQTVKDREGILRRALAELDKREKLNNMMLEQLRGKTMFKPQATPSGLSPAPTDDGGVARPKDKAAYDALRPGTKFIDPEGNERIKP